MTSTYKVGYDVTEDEGQTRFVAVFTVEAENEQEAVRLAGDKLYGSFLIEDYTFDWEFPCSVEKVVAQ